MYLDELITHQKIRNIPLISRQSKRAKRISIKLNPTSRAVELVYPTCINRDQAQAFLKSQEDWLIKNITTLQEKITLVEQEKITLFGRQYSLVIKPRTKTQHQSYIEDGQLIILANNSERAAVCLRLFIQKHAHKVFEERIYDYARQLNMVPSKISVKDTKTRWGSCSSDKAVSISWRLAFAPTEVAFYVAAHEVAHMKHMNHSKRFWRVVEDIYPNYMKARVWLQKHGHTLHAYI